MSTKDTHIDQSTDQVSPYKHIAKQVFIKILPSFIAIFLSFVLLYEHFTKVTEDDLQMISVLKEPITDLDSIKSFDALSIELIKDNTFTSDDYNTLVKFADELVAKENKIFERNINNSDFEQSTNELQFTGTLDAQPMDEDISTSPPLQADSIVNSLRFYLNIILAFFACIALYYLLKIQRADRLAKQLEEKENMEIESTTRDDVK